MRNGHVVRDNLGGGIEYSSRTVCNGHVVNAVCSVCGWWDLI